MSRAGAPCAKLSNLPRDSRTWQDQSTADTRAVQFSVNLLVYQVSGRLRLLFMPQLSVLGIEDWHGGVSLNKFIFSICMEIS